MGRWVAQETAYQIKVNGGTAPTRTAESNTVAAKYNKAGCRDPKSLNIQVSPQLTLSQPRGVASPASTTGLTPAC